MLYLSVYYKGYYKGYRWTTRRKRYGGEAWAFMSCVGAPASRHLHVQHPRSSPNSAILGYFIAASLCGHDCLHCWSLMINSTFSFFLLSYSKGELELQFPTLEPSLNLSCDVLSFWSFLGSPSHQSSHYQTKDALFTPKIPRVLRSYVPGPRDKH